MVRKVKMPDQDNTKTPPVDSPTPSVSQGADIPAPIIPSDAIVDPTPSSDDTSSKKDEEKVEKEVDNSEVMAAVAAKINESHNILVALSSDPSIDELAAAIGLSLYLDRIGKRVTAIYSGGTPNVLQFLKPEETFEQSAEILQDFVIALNKEKADHLRYKIDGDYVKIFITPYKSRISSEDLEFSYGDYNIDLVIALNVANGIDLDDALREHGRIMHDAIIINVTTGKPGKLGEIEWADKGASSVSEMIAELLYGLKNKEGLQKEESTAFLSGIVASTNRFATASTTSRTMMISSKLIDSGANQQLIAKNITSDVENQFFTFASSSDSSEKTAKRGDPTKLDIEHGNEEGVDETVEVSTAVNEKESTLLDDLKAAEATLSGAGAEVTPDESNKPVDLDGSKKSDKDDEDEKEDKADKDEEGDKDDKESKSSEEETATGTEFVDKSSSVPEHEQSVEEQSAANNFEASVKPEKVIAPPANFNPETLGEGTNKYGRMLEDALAEVENELSDPNTVISSPSDTVSEATPATGPLPNPAAGSAPFAASAPDINGVPDINYMPLPGDEVLPPPPTPPVDFDNLDIEAPAPGPAPTPLGPQPAMQDQIYGAQAANPGAFQIPGTS